VRFGPQRGRRPKTAGGARGQWFTPPPLADAAVRFFRLRGLRVIDLGAGTGSLTAALLRAGCDVLSIERDPRLYRVLCDRITAVPGKGWLPLCVDAFSAEADAAARLFEPDAVLSNPVFEDDQIVRFAWRALEWAPRVDLIIPGPSLMGVEITERLWSRVTQTGELRCKRRPSFDGVGTGQKPIVVVEIVRGVPRGDQIVRVGHYDDGARA
jgi:hypothetical protein